MAKVKANGEIVDGAQDDVVEAKFNTNPDFAAPLEVFKLNTNKSYGTISGTNDGRAYEQGGKVFNTAGDEWGSPEEVKAQKEGRAAEEATKVAALAAQVIAQMKAQ